MTDPDVIVIGSGVGGLCSAVLLGARGFRVLVVEKADTIGGKAGTVQIDGVEVDTGPSVLTLPHVFDEIFAAAGMERSEEITLTTPSPAFRYIYRDGVILDVFAHAEETLASVERTLGSDARRELAAYLAYSARIWEAAAPHFVYSGAPDLGGLLLGGFQKWRAVGKIDPFRTLKTAIEEQVKSPHLRMLLKRYATYNGSDVRRAPATLGCIAHVELSLGGFGVRGGMIELVRALERAARRVGVQFLTSTGVTTICRDGGRVTGVTLSDGRRLRTERIVSNADVAHLALDLLGSPKARKSPEALSMSAHTGIIRAPRTSPARTAHTVIFPEDYDAEFSDIFDKRRIPLDPTVYVCAQEACHERPGWTEDEPLFCMINAPALEDFTDQEPTLSLQARIMSQLRAQGITDNDASIVWWRSPEDLAERFPGSRGSLYGAASNTMDAAFKRPSNRVPSISGLYLASGSAHPGGGVPMVALSAKQAIKALLADRKDAA
jgi:1-hydroxycarotenoid 3,4-desaturase